MAIRGRTAGVIVGTAVVLLLFLVNGCGGSSAQFTVPLRDTRAVAALVAATSSISAEYARQQGKSGALTQEIKAHGLTSSLRRRLVAVIGPAAVHLLAIKKRLDRTAPAVNPRLAETQRVLSLWLARQIEGDRVALTSTTNAEFIRRTRAVSRKIQPLSRRLQKLSVQIQARYPSVSDWKFLPNS